MKLSVVIVNYNVRHFLDQCLQSVQKAIAGIDAEVFVVDNNSVDGSVEMLRERFPWVRCIANKENLGFSKANNLAIAQASGTYILLLNPDTVVEEDTFSKTVKFMDEHPDAGGLGVQMIDGKGHFLPESKRGLPSPSVAFYKISGLSALFPKSRTFGRYHLGFLDKNETHAVDVLAGAFMLLRKAVIDRIGLLDETFFMYGEDIDLSYRITQAGYKNYYYPGTRIIHYKGESTSKSSVNYVIVFYKAMIIFAEKHFSKQHARTFSFLIRIAIYLRAGMAILRRVVTRLAIPLADAVLFLAGMYILKNYWEHTVKDLHYPPVFMAAVVPAYILIWILCIFFSGGYDRPVRVSRVARGIFTGTVFILVVYALLNESFRFSRALILLGAAWATVSASVLRLVLNLTNIRAFRIERRDRKRLAIAGTPDEGKRVLGMLQLAGTPVSFTGFVAVSGSGTPDASYDGYCLGKSENLDQIVQWYQLDEVIFCARDFASQEIITRMMQLNTLDIEYKIAPAEGGMIIGSNSVNEQGDLYLADTNTITSRANRRNKRVLDSVVALLCLPALPVLIFVVENPGGFVANLFDILTGKKSWVGFAPVTNGYSEIGLRKGVLHPADGLPLTIPDAQTLHRLNLLYARDYKVASDLRIILKSLRMLGRRS